MSYLYPGSSVRFAGDIQSYSFDRHTPSPSHSDESSIWDSPMAKPIALPSVSTHSEYIHGVHHTLSSLSRYAIDNIDISNQLFIKSMDQDILAASATETRTSRFRFFCPDLLAWNHGFVVVESKHNGRYVTVQDVLCTLYGTLRTTVPVHEMAGMPGDVTMRVNYSYQRRLARARSEGREESEKARGYRRIDFLPGHQRLSGLQLASNREWALVIL